MSTAPAVAPSPARARRRWRPDPVVLGAAALVGVPFLLRLRLLRVRGFGPDEFEHLHFAWCVSKGMLPYRDYFEHHTPWLHYLMAPLLSWFDLDRDPGQAISAILLGRGLMWICAGATLVFTWALGRAWHSGRTGALAALLVGNAAFFLSKSLEFRPDVPAAALQMAALWLAFRGLKRQQEGRPGDARRLGLAGLLLGAAAMFTQKILFGLPGFAAGLVWPRPAPAVGHPRRRAVIALALGFALPWAVTLAFFASHGALALFFHYNFLLNVTWQGPSVGGFLRELLREDLALVLLGAVGAALALADVRRGDGGAARLLVILSTASLWGMLLVHPAVTRHYFLLLLPPLAVFAADALERTAVLLASRATTPALVVAMAALSVQPLLRFRAAFERRNDGTLERLRWVQSNVAPWEPVLDGYSGLGVFRPHVGFHGFQHGDALAVQTEDEIRALETGLRAGRPLPKAIFWNHYLQEGVSAPLAQFLLTNYADIGLYPIRGRLFDNGTGWWQDEGQRRLGWTADAAREPHLFVGSGWQRSQGRGLRRTAGAAAEALLPVREPGRFRLTLRAWAGPDAPCGLRVTVKDRPSEAVCVQRGWREYAFDLPEELGRGFNLVRMTYPCPPGCGATAEWGTGRWLLAETLSLHRIPAP